MVSQHIASKGPAWLEKYWVLIPLGLVAIIGLVILESALLNIVISPDLPLQQVVDIPLAGGPSRFDYQSLDPKTNILFISHSGANMVIAFDTTTRKVLANIPNVANVHGVLAVADLGRVYASDADDNLVYVIDEHTMHIIDKIPVGDGPDGLAYDPITQSVFVSDETGNNDAVINTRTEQRVAMISLGGQAGNTVYDSASHLIFVAVETLNQFVAINPVTRRIVSRSPLPGCDFDHGLSIDASQQLAFVACINNAALLMVDLQTMKVMATQSVGKNPDVLALDTNLQTLFVAAESGVVAVFDVHGRTLRKVAEGFLAPNAHSVAVNQITHYLYFPLQNVNNQPVLRIGLFHYPS